MEIDSLLTIFQNLPEMPKPLSRLELIRLSFSPVRKNIEKNEILWINLNVQVATFKIVKNEH